MRELEFEAEKHQQEKMQGVSWKQINILIILYKAEWEEENIKNKFEVLTLRD